MGAFSKSFQGWNVTRQSNRVYGMVNGFYFDALQIPNLGEVVTTIYFKSDDQTIRQGINQVFLNLKAQNSKLKSIELKEFSLVIHQKTQGVKKMVALTEYVTGQITQFLKIKGAATGCQICGGSNPGFYEVNGGMNCLCENCSKEVLYQLEQNRQVTVNRKSKPIPGFIGALIGSLIGAALWFIIYQAGYIAGIAGAATMICAMKGWEILGKNLDIKGIIISFAISLVMIYLANQAALSYMIVNEFAKYDVEVSFTEVFTDFSDVLEDLSYDDVNLMDEFIGDLLVGYLLSLLVGIPSIINAYKKASGSYKMKKI
ncbi:MAG: hypothetical protein ACI39R_01110 [Lachnospiraceae bacterium]